MQFSRHCLLTAVVILLSGCVSLTSHLFSMRKQTCEFDRYFNVELGQSAEVSMQEPVLSDRDVFLLIGAPPTRRIETAEGMLASYVFEQIPTTPEIHGTFAGKEFEITLMFISSRKGYLLSAIKTSEIPAELIESALPLLANRAAIALQVCEMPFNFLYRSVSLEIDRDILDSLPSRQSVISWLGSPLEAEDIGIGLAYEFQLKGDDKDLPILRFAASYEKTADYPTIINVSFTHYHARIDVPAGKILIKINWQT